jgi:RimJ/RimL family protein N-acetyltransferase
MEIATERLVLRPWRADDAPRMLAIYSRMDVVRWLGDGEPVLMTDLEQAGRTIDRWSELSARPPLGFWAAEIAATGVVAGTVLLAALPGDAGDVEIGWHFHPDSHGHGYATEAARALLGHGFAAGLPALWALTHLGNERSQVLCRRLGMRERGEEQSWYDVPMLVFSLSAQEYAEQG